MEVSDKTARQMYEEVKARPGRARFGFGAKPALVNVDLQKAYTAVGEFVTAYETDPRQVEYVNELAALCREHGLPVVWTYVAYMDSGEECVADKHESPHFANLYDMAVKYTDVVPVAEVLEHLRKYRRPE